MTENTAAESALGRILVVVSGSGSNLQAIIDGCQSGSIPGQVCAVISNNPDVYGLERANIAGIEARVLSHRNYNSREDYDQALAELIDSYSPDLIVLAGFMRILTPEFVGKYIGRLLNIHPSLLPKYTGLHTHQRALENGDTEHGATVHFVTAELDGGPAIIQGAVGIKAEDDETSLATRLQMDIEHKIYPLAVTWCLNGRIELSKDGVYLDGKPLPKSGYRYKADSIHI